MKTGNAKVELRESVPAVGRGQAPARRFTWIFRGPGTVQAACSYQRAASAGPQSGPFADSCHSASLSTAFTSPDLALSKTELLILWPDTVCVSDRNRLATNIPDALHSMTA